MRINVFYGSGLISTDEYNCLISILE
jgi:hypothetical protein